MKLEWNLKNIMVYKVFSVWGKRMRMVVADLEIVNRVTPRGLYPTSSFRGVGKERKREK